MLPSILNIADEFKLESDPKTYGKKESLFKCPFCLEDANKPKKYYLSLNTKDNVFKCWYCKESGGVLQFEAMLSNKPFEEIRKKYFGERKKNLHPAYTLTPDQLKQIGWQDKKRRNFKAFQEQKEEVIKDWKKYEREELTKHYALFTLIAHFPIQNERSKHYEWFKEVCQHSKVDNLAKAIVQQWNAPKKKEWAITGEKIAQIAYNIAYQTGDFEFLNLFLNVLFIHEMMKMQFSKPKRFRGNNTSISV